VHIEVPPQVGKVDIGELVRVVDAGIVDQHVQPTECLESQLDQPRRSLLGRNVRGVSYNRPTVGGYRLGSPSGWFGISAFSVDSDASVIDNHARSA
jgi:hypothetical protein